MRGLSIWTMTIAAVALTTASTLAQDVRHVERDGIVYRESRRVVQRPVAETQYETRNQTVWREEMVTDYHDQLRAVHTPVTEYRWKSCLRGRWNPFARPYVEPRLVPETRWETKYEVVQKPVTRRSLVPETRTVQVPVTKYKIAEEEVISRVAVGPSSNVGGIAKLDNDPPKQSTNWKANESGTVRR